ncbi:ferric ABC transporter ATP-binding protein [Avibacterium paragallinarum]|uniref:ferric ABC transporter ATP-binding protein n=1 Tax=Avibacterium paragallinarum TaxID=728 RepID=UPI003979AB5F
MNNENFLLLKNITKSFDQATILQDFSLSIKQGKMVTLLGPSGCGKTTLLRIIAGLDSPSSGQIFIGSQDITKLPIQKRNIGIVFQSYALFPHMSIGENVGYGLHIQAISAAERKKRIQEALELVDLSGFENRYIDQVSGGQQQRIALARALILKPQILLFDEPLSNLDANLRHSMREKIREIQQHFNITALYVTHNQNEAFAVSDEIIVMDKGKIVQQGSAQKLYQFPNSAFVANFMSENNIFDGILEGNRISIGKYTFSFVNAEKYGLTNGNCLVGIRPEAIYLSKRGYDTQYCKIQRAIYMGSHWEIIVKWQGKTLFIHIPSNHFNIQTTEAYVNFAEHGIFLLKKE